MLGVRIRSLQADSDVHILLGLDNVLVVPIGLLDAGFVQSANWKKYLVSGSRPVASSFAVKSTS